MVSVEQRIPPKVADKRITAFLERNVNDGSRLKVLRILPELIHNLPEAEELCERRGIRLEVCERDVGDEMDEDGVPFASQDEDPNAVIPGLVAERSVPDLSSLHNETLTSEKNCKVQ